MGAKIVLTGATGFIGENILEYFKESKCEFFKISRFPKNDELGYKELEEKLWDKSNICIHLAGNNHHVKRKIKAQEYFKVNTELTKQLFDQFLESTCDTFIYMSSVKAVADTVYGVLTEETNPNPQTIYGLSKLKAEEYLLSKALPKGKKLFVLRPCMIHGPGNKGNLNVLFNFVSKGVPYPLGAYSNKRSFLSIENLCFVINELMNNKTIPSGLYNVSDNKPLSTIDLVKLIGKVVNKPSKIIKTPKFLVRLLAKFGDFFPLPINSERLNKLTENYVVSNAKIKKAINKNFPVSVENGVLNTIKWFQT